MDTQRKVAIEHDRDKTSVESKTVIHCRITQITKKKNGQIYKSITIQCNEETTKSKIDTTQDCLRLWKFTNAIKLFVPYNNQIVVYACQSMLKRIDVLKDGFYTVHSFKGVIDNYMNNV